MALSPLNWTISSGLSCYSDTLVKDYKKLENQAGYKWCDYNTCAELQGFPKCASETINCPKKNRVEPTGNEEKQFTLLEQENDRKLGLRRALELLHQKMLITNQNKLNRYDNEYINKKTRWYSI